MGCCLSTNSAAPPQPKNPRIPTSAASAQHYSGSKSPPPVDEETVKQVLSETPAIPPRRSPPFHGSERMLHQNAAAAVKNPAVAFGSDDPPDVDSEIHSTHNESFSTENDGALHWPRLDSRPPPGGVKRENAAGRSPARRSDTSPGRVKPGSGYSMKTGGGESSLRRSRSPVNRSDSRSSKTVLDAGKALRKMGNYPGRVGYGSCGRIRKGEEEEEREREEPPTNNELLESSLVSLECFIFL